MVYSLSLYCFFHISLVRTPKTISSTLKKIQQSKATHKILPNKNPELINSSDTSQYDNLIFIGNPAIPARMNIYKLSRRLNNGTNPTIKNRDSIESKRNNHERLTKKNIDNIAGKVPNAN